MVDWWSVFKEGAGESDARDTFGVSQFFENLFKPPSHSDPSTWNDYTTGKEKQICVYN